MPCLFASLRSDLLDQSAPAEQALRQEDQHQDEDPVRDDLDPADAYVVGREVLEHAQNKAPGQSAEHVADAPESEGDQGFDEQR